MLIGQANSLWHEGVFDTLIDATNLNQSVIRQAQLRVTGRPASGHGIANRVLFAAIARF